MPYHFIPNTNHDLVVIDARPVSDCGVDVLEIDEYPIVGWKIEEHPKDGTLDAPVPVAIGWEEPYKLHGDEWGVLDRSRGVVFNDHGLWSCPVAEWKANREKEFSMRQSGLEN